MRAFPIVVFLALCVAAEPAHANSILSVGGVS